VFVNPKIVCLLAAIDLRQFMRNTSIHIDIQNTQRGYWLTTVLNLPLIHADRHPRRTIGPVIRHPYHDDAQQCLLSAWKLGSRKFLP
jgi:hypothetical protein